jgi:Arc/MetJ-type ribon-helix-helix transcriptional regulator
VTILLPPHIESSIQAAVHSGHFASVDDAMAKAATLLLERLGLEEAQSKPSETVADNSPDPLLGVWRDASDVIDEIVADAMRLRREEPWRAIIDFAPK